MHWPIWKPKKGSNFFSHSLSTFSTVIIFMKEGIMSQRSNSLGPFCLWGCFWYLSGKVTLATRMESIISIKINTITIISISIIIIILLKDKMVGGNVPVAILDAAAQLKFLGWRSSNPPRMPGQTFQSAFVKTSELKFTRITNQPTSQPADKSRSTALMCLVGSCGNSAKKLLKFHKPSGVWDEMSEI